MDTSLSADQRARLLLDNSTLDQKLRWLDEQSANNPTQTVFNIGGGLTTTMPLQVPCTPVIQYTDGPSSVVSGAGPNVTAFPAPVALSATWSEALAEQKGKAQALEAFRKHRNVLLAPGLASGRDPRSGRTSEYLGEDPLLGGVLAGAGIVGIGANPDAPVEAVIKHYVANEQELDRTLSSSNVDPRTLRELYTLPFEIAIRKGNPGGIMCAFNDVNNVPSCGNPTILNTILRDEIGFEGWVVTDFGARHSLTAATPSLAAGLDQELNRWRFWNPDAIKAAIAAGTVTEQMVDTAAFRVVRAHIRAGLFDVPLPAVPDDVVTSDAHKAISQQVAEQGAVLLKNDDGLLPITATGRTIAVIGQTASNTPTGGISAASVCSATAPSVPCAPPKLQAPLDSITAWASANGGSVVFNDGADPAAAASTAASADVAIVFGYYREGEFADRANLNLDGNGDALIDAVATANPRTVVVLQTGGPVLMPWLAKVGSVLEIWYAGERMGPAVTNLLSGAVNPRGKLTHTFPASEADLPTAGSPAQYPGIFSETGTTTPPSPRNNAIRQVEYSEGLKIGYRWYAAQGIEPLFPFGHGLSYTTFEYSSLLVTPVATGHNAVRIRFRVKNTGTVAGTEVAQAYVELPAYTGEPSKRLVGWQSVTLNPGQSRSVEITLSRDELKNHHLLEYWNPTKNDWNGALGIHKITVGGSFETALKGVLLGLPLA
jgi:beta-glucosidase